VENNVQLAVIQSVKNEAQPDVVRDAGQPSTVVQQHVCSVLRNTEKVFKKLGESVRQCYEKKDVQDEHEDDDAYEDVPDLVVDSDDEGPSWGDTDPNIVTRAAHHRGDASESATASNVVGCTDMQSEHDKIKTSHSSEQNFHDILLPAPTPIQNAPSEPTVDHALQNPSSIPSIPRSPLADSGLRLLMFSNTSETGQEQKQEKENEIAIHKQEDLERYLELRRCGVATHAPADVPCTLPLSEWLTENPLAPLPSGGGEPLKTYPDIINSNLPACKKRPPPLAIIRTRCLTVCIVWRRSFQDRQRPLGHCDD
jgi:hypothetical protein